MSKMEEKKAIIEHNTMIAELLEKLAELDNIDKKTKDELTTILILGMMTEDGEFVFDKVLRWLDKRARGEGW